MKRDDRMKQRKAADRKEHMDNIMKVAEEAGLDFVDYELPPDEVDEEEVKKSVGASLLALIPFTQAYYESAAAEEEMDNLKKIRIEKVRASDFLAMSKMGKHDEALEQMMAETNYDFFYFNKLKMKMEEEGRFKFERANLNPFQELDRSSNRNRIKRALHANYAMPGFNDSINQHRNKVADMPEQVKVEETCMWRGKNKTGEVLKCNNLRLRLNNFEKDDDESSVGGESSIVSMWDKNKSSKNKKKQSSNYCCYHHSTCINYHPDKVKINTPNPMTLCTECFVTNGSNTKLIPLTLETCPGVAPANILSLSKIKKKIELADDIVLKPKSQSRKNKSHLCQWEPTNEKIRGYSCNNPICKDPDTGIAYSDTCAWHLRVCVLSHPINSNNNIILIPNQFGLCQMHHIAMHAIPPPNIPFPYPGMALKKGADWWKNNRGRHWATPRFDPKPDVSWNEYEIATWPQDALEAIDYILRKTIYFYKRFWRSKKSALLIQKRFRRYQFERFHIEKKLLNSVKPRIYGAIKIQNQMRRYLADKNTREMRKRCRAAIMLLQRIYRGHHVRLTLYRDWAIRRIQKFMKRLHFLKFRDTVIMIMQLRILFTKKHKLCIKIQRLYRGYYARVVVFQMKLFNIITRRCVRVIGNYYWIYRRKKPKRVVIPPSEQWILNQFMKKLAHMILELYLDQRKRRQLAEHLNESAPSIQKLVRGFLAKLGTKKMSYLRYAIRSWCQPKYAIEFMDKLLLSKIFYLASKNSQEIIATGSPAKVSHVRIHLPENMQSKYEVDFRIFQIAIEKWYKASHIPLLLSEKISIMNKFKNPMNGNIMIGMLDDYIDLHKYPCRKHGRKICGSCFFRRDCLFKSCKCRKYSQPKGDVHGICRECDHPRTLHMMCPLQLKEDLSKK
eukprot:gene6965-9520_t